MLGRGRDELVRSGNQVFLSKKITSEMEVAPRYELLTLLYTTWVRKKLCNLSSISKDRMCVGEMNVIEGSFATCLR